MGKFNRISKVLSDRRWQPVVCSLVFGLGLTFTGGGDVKAQDNAPSELQMIVEQLEQAANAENLEQVQQLYGAEFVTENLSRPQFFESLEQFWQEYSRLNYQTKLMSWEQQGNQWIAETETVVTGMRQTGGRAVSLRSTLRSRQVIENGQFIRQDILSERTQLSMGENPPKVNVNLPDQVRSGEMFNFDVIVEEPLRGDLLLGGAFEEIVESDRYFQPSDVKLELLNSGGLFKRGRFEDDSDRWISAVLIRGDGITIVTQRLRVD